ncbi:RNA polymerase sigma factor [Streptomyces fuscigenes]|uniref:RNA polymerase sigma factor n=1 Tax=Streptomyces fuscigenes TaxID=1528880 RepID=UPI001F218035|nr:RNA polymerase sigma factor [Streptomyces fuscigenes]MCF3960903.1 RNA polymerase sigma factor [Streptomyces fuscigenes]
MAPSATDDSPFDTLFCGLLPRLYRRAVMLAGTRQAAEDAVHEAYLKLAARPERLLGHPEPYAYAFRAMASAVHDARRKERRHVLTDVSEPFEGAGGAGGAASAGWDGGLERRQGELEAVRLLGRLSARQAAVVILVDLDGYTLDQAARIMRVHRGTAARHRSRALGALRAELAGPDARDGGRRDRA